MKIIECPRDAMQGLPNFIPTKEKANYINRLLKVGFDTIDFGSFVSPKAIPQMRDTAEVLSALDLGTTKSNLLAIIANTRGAEDACKFNEISYLGFPLSLSESFQQRNTNRSIAEALETVKQIQMLCIKHNKTLVVYLSMGFGNPYNEHYSPETVHEFVNTLNAIAIKVISLADTIGASNPELITKLFKKLIPSFKEIEFGAHFHSVPNTAKEKMEAAYNAGCRRIDTAMGGMGGCPMAKDDLTGNIATETLINFLESRHLLPQNFDFQAYKEASEFKLRLFG